MRDWCDQAELFHRSTHGLRKVGATIAAENGAPRENGCWGHAYAYAGTKVVSILINKNSREVFVGGAPCRTEQSERHQYLVSSRDKTPTLEIICLFVSIVSRQLTAG
jgi:hypothetical protein